MILIENWLDEVHIVSIYRAKLWFPEEAVIKPVQFAKTLGINGLGLLKLIIFSIQYPSESICIFGPYNSL